MNIIDAVINLVNKPVTEVVSYYKGHNRANNAGEALEEYIKDLFANSFGLNEQARLQKMSEVFSYLGNNSNPPDAMLKKGDAIEIKKIETNTASLALNSSYPKQVLRSDSTMISSACRNAEVWDKKDIVYCVGVVQNNSLKHLAMFTDMIIARLRNAIVRLKQQLKTVWNLFLMWSLLIQMN